MKTLHRGVNLSGWWEATPRNAFSDENFHHIRNMGFDFVRIPIDPQWLAVKDKDEQARIVQKLHCDLVRVANHDLAMVLDLHPAKKAQNDIIAMPPETLPVYLSELWKNIAPALEGIPANRVAFQLLNEPPRELGSYWWEAQKKLAAAMRKAYPHNLLIAGSIGNGPSNYPDVHPYPDTNLMYDFHFYQPMFLTHHGAEWLKPSDPAEKYDHIAYPSTSAIIPSGAKMKDYVREGWNKDKLAAEMASVIAWGKRHKVKLICLEFGVYRPYVSLEARANWLKDMRRILESYNIPWAVWEYNEGFGILESDSGSDRKIRSSLGLNQ